MVPIFCFAPFTAVCRYVTTSGLDSWHASTMDPCRNPNRFANACVVQEKQVQNKSFTQVYEKELNEKFVCKHMTKKHLGFTE